MLWSQGPRVRRILVAIAQTLHGNCQFADVSIGARLDEVLNLHQAESLRYPTARECKSGDPWRSWMHVRVERRFLSSFVEAGN
jgi:hypothetical protein